MYMKKPYIKKYEVVGDINVWIFDGNYIRTNLDEEFVNRAQHYHFKFIPKNEFWIDKEHGKGPDEEKFFVQYMMNIRKFLKEGKSMKKAVDKAEKIEKLEREKSFFFQKQAVEMLDKQKLLKKIHLKLLKKYSREIKIWIVDGKLVGDIYYIYFTEGGHDKVYNFIPKNEIWIDNDLSPKERKFVLLHEAHERNLMSRKMTSINYSNIRDIHLRQSFTQRIFNIGDIYIDTSGSNKMEMIVKGISNPREFKRKIGLHHK